MLSLRVVFELLFRFVVLRGPRILGSGFRFGVIWIAVLTSARSHAFSSFLLLLLRLLIMNMPHVVLLSLLWLLQLIVDSTGPLIALSAVV